MARHPEWFARLDEIEESLRGGAAPESLGRNEIGALFGARIDLTFKGLHLAAVFDLRGALAAHNSKSQI